MRELYAEIVELVLSMVYSILAQQVATHIFAYVILGLTGLLSFNITIMTPTDFTICGEYYVKYVNLSCLCTQQTIATDQTVMDLLMKLLIVKVY